jgi:hypothetical protein
MDRAEYKTNVDDFINLPEFPEMAGKYQPPRIFSHLDQINSVQTVSRLVIAQGDGGRFKYIPFESVEDFILWNIIDNSNGSQYLCEVIRGPCKLFFDIESDEFTEEADRFEMIDEIAAQILSAFNSNAIPLKVSDLMIWDSSRDGKASFHIVIPIQYPSITDCKGVASFIASKCGKFSGCIDLGVYNRNRVLRMPFAEKSGKPDSFKRFADLTDFDPIERTTVKASARCRLLGGKAKKLPKLLAFYFCGLVSTHHGLTELSPLIINNNPAKSLDEFTEVDPIDFETVCNLVAERYLGVFSCEVASGLIRLNRLKSSSCEVCKRVHDSESSFVTIRKTPETVLYVLGCHRDTSEKRKSITLGFRDLNKVDEVEEIPTAAEISQPVQMIESPRCNGITLCGTLGEFLEASERRVLSNLDEMAQELSKVLRISPGSDRKVATFEDGRIIETPYPRFLRNHANTVVGYILVKDVGKQPVKMSQLCGSVNLFYDKTVYNPYVIEDEKTTPKQINEYVAKPLLMNAEAEKVECLRRHILEVIASGDQKLAQYVEDWISFLFAYPDKKSGQCLFLLGEEGTGKNTFADMIGDALGSDLFTEFSNLDQLTSRFNSARTRKRLLHLSELKQTAEGKVDYQALATLRSLITDKHELRERKGIDAETGESYAALIISTNYRGGLHTPADDRRQVIIELSDKRRNDVAYFSKMRKSVDPLHVRTFYTRRGLEIGESELFTRLRQIPMTRARLEAIADSLPTPVAFLVAFMGGECSISSANGFGEGKKVDDYEGRVPSGELYQGYREWSAVNGHQPFSATRFGTTLAKYIDKVKRSSVVYLVDSYRAPI